MKKISLESRKQLRRRTGLPCGPNGRSNPGRLRDLKQAEKQWQEETICCHVVTAEHGTSPGGETVRVRETFELPRTLSIDRGSVLCGFPELELPD